jgi:hypothetical protein
LLATEKLKNRGAGRGLKGGIVEQDRLLVYVIQRGKNEQDYWNRCGVAFVNRDGSINVKLDLLPGVDLQIRKPAEKK